MPTLQKKTLEVLGTRGTGKATLMGNLLFKCGGIDLLAMESLQRAGIPSYDKVVSHLQRRGIPTSFYTRKAPAEFTFLGNADCTIYLVDITSDPSSIAEPSLDALRHAKSVILLINKMDQLEWSKESYINTVGIALAELERSGVDLQKVKTIPISALDGDNLIERSEKATWYEGWLNRDGVSVGGWTLIDAIDAL